MSVVDELRALGVEAWSVDLKPAEKPTRWHIQGDARSVISEAWDLLIASPVCTRMANSGAKHLYAGMKKENGPNPERWELLEQDAAFFRLFLDAEHIPHRAIENSIMHRHARERVGRQDQVVQPWWFGDPFFKGTALWLRRLPLLVPTDRLTPPKPGTEEHKAWSAVFRAPPSPERAADRSRTFPGMAKAWARQWVEFIRSGREQLSLLDRLAA